LNYTIITAANLSVGGVPLNVTRSSTGLAFGTGLDYRLNERWSLNLDYKYVNIHTSGKVQSTGAILTNADINPNLLSFGIGYRF
jgi:outer membrane protein